MFAFNLDNKIKVTKSQSTLATAQFGGNQTESLKDILLLVIFYILKTSCDLKNKVKVIKIQSVLTFWLIIPISV